MRDSDIWIIELRVLAARSLMLQAWLLGEDGLGVMRCLHADKTRQQFWTTVCQRDDARAWIVGLPESFEILDEWLWDGKED